MTEHIIHCSEECCGCPHNTVDYANGGVVGSYCDKPGKCQYKPMGDGNWCITDGMEDETEAINRMV